MNKRSFIFLCLALTISVSSKAKDCPKSGNVKDYFLTLLDSVHLIEDSVGQIKTLEALLEKSER